MSPESTHSRRRFLAGLGAVAVGGLLAGCSSTDPSPEFPSVDFSRVVNVEEAGADASGEEPIDSLLTDVTADDTLLYFPEGRYLLKRVWHPPPGVRKLGILGPEATIVPPDGYDGFMFAVGEHDAVDELYVRGLRFDVSAENTGARALQAKVNDRLRVEDVSVRGRQDTNQNAVSVNVLNPGGSGRIERLSMPDGGVPGGNAVGCLVTPKNRGHLVFEDCVVGGFPNNGLYASPSRGRIDVRGGEYFNNDIANVRVSGPSLVDGVTVWADLADEANRNVRGIRLKAGRDITVEGCEVDVRNVPYSDGAISLAAPLESAVIRETTINVDADAVPAVRIKPPSDGVAERVVHCDGVSITGTAANGSAVRIVERNRALFTNTEIRQSGSNRNGLHLIDSDRVVFRGGRISVTGEPVVTENSSFKPRNVTIRPPLPDR
jgi:hypothetical protein